MNGIELARGYYNDHGREMLETEFPELLSSIAVAFTGSGSEHYGFDDEISRDHDFEPGFSIFLPGEDLVDRRQEFLLTRAYSRLPKEYMGVKRQNVSPVGGDRHGVIRLEDYYQKATGTVDGRLPLEAWLHIPDYALAEAVNGEVFFDGLGELTAFRRRLSEMPEDVWLKRLAGNLLIMAQSGQYNFTRCLKHGEREAAQLASGEFVQAAMKCAFLLEGKYMPYYKWSFRALRGLSEAGDLAEKLSFLIQTGTESDKDAWKKYDMIEDVASDFIARLMQKDLTRAVCGDLEKHAYSVNDRIRDGMIRNMNILEAV